MKFFYILRPKIAKKNGNPKTFYSFIINLEFYSLIMVLEIVSMQQILGYKGLYIFIKGWILNTKKNLKGDIGLIHSNK